MPAGLMNIFAGAARGLDRYREQQERKAKEEQARQLAAELLKYQRAGALMQAGATPETAAEFYESGAEVAPALRRLAEDKATARRQELARKFAEGEVKTTREGTEKFISELGPGYEDIAAEAILGGIIPQNLPLENALAEGRDVLPKDVHQYRTYARETLADLLGAIRARRAELAEQRVREAEARKGTPSPPKEPPPYVLLERMREAKQEAKDRRSAALRQLQQQIELRRGFALSRIEDPEQVARELGMNVNIPSETDYLREAARERGLEDIYFPQRKRRPGPQGAPQGAGEAQGAVGPVAPQGGPAGQGGWQSAEPPLAPLGLFGGPGAENRVQTAVALVSELQRQGRAPREIPAALAAAGYSRAEAEQALRAVGLY